MDTKEHEKFKTQDLLDCSLCGHFINTLLKQGVNESPIYLHKSEMRARQFPA